MQFITRYLGGEGISQLTREFGLSRKTGHTQVKRFELFGPEALKDRSSRPHRNPNRTLRAKVEEILKLRKKYPSWGPKKLKERLHRVQPDIRWPAHLTKGENNGNMARFIHGYRYWISRWRIKNHH